MDERPIPCSGEQLPVIGCGTYQGFDHVPGSDVYRRLPGVLVALLSAGGRVLDTSPVYGPSETTSGELLATAGSREKPFLATKVWTTGRAAGIRQMDESMRRLGVQCIDLMQIHNLVDWRVHLSTLRAWREAGRIRYLGITHYSSSAYDEVEAVLRSQDIDFLQINYSIEDREAEERLLPLAADRGVAVLGNMPFGGGGLLRRLRSKPLPAWAEETDCESWSQVLLKFVLSHSALTCVIPGSSRAEHMASNAKAGSGHRADKMFWHKKIADIRE